MFREERGDCKMNSIRQSPDIDFNKDAKMRFSAGENMKRERGTSTWNKEGREYFKSAETAWKRAFKTGTEDYKILRQYWNKWIEKEGKHSCSVVQRME